MKINKWYNQSGLHTEFQANQIHVISISKEENKIYF